MTKDYYAILGVSSGASQEEIQLAYEKMISLSGESPQPLERKLEIEEAYLVLSNSQTRSQYDGMYNNTSNLIRNFDGFDNSKLGQNGLIGMAAMAWQARPSFPNENLGGQAGLKNQSEGLNLDIDFDDPEGMLPENLAEIFQAAVKNILNATDQLKVVQNQEENLKTGGDIFLDLPLSPQKVRQGGYIPLEYQRYIYCSRCQDKSVLEARNCPKCHGVGRVMANRRVEIKIPKDSADGAVLQIASEGHAASMDSGQNGSGDLFIKVVIRDES